MPRITLLAGLALLVAAPTAARAEFAGSNGKVAYVGKVDGQTTLLVRAGGRVQAVLDGAAMDSPAWSPQGQRIAIVRNGPDGKDLWTLAQDGQGARQLTASGSAATDPAWSPTGAEIAFTDGARGSRHVYAVTADGGAVRQVTNGTADERDPTWSTRGQIAYVVRTSRTGDDLYSVPAAGGKPRRLAKLKGNEHSPSWSPDGRRLVYVRAGALWMMDANGRHRRRILRGPITAPSWAPSGKRLLFSAGRPGRRQIFSVGLKGRGRRALSTTRSDGRTPDWQPAGFDPVIAAAGDIACDAEGRYYNSGAGVPRRCGQLRTSNLLLQQDLWQVFPLGDNQYQYGQLDDYMAVYDPTWGRTKHLQRPVIGNHEYATGGSGYFDYFNGIGAIDGPAGDRTTGGYYSFDLDSWHVVALNTNCQHVPGGCDAGSPQEQWLAADLAAHPNRCTLAIWHHPRYSSFQDNVGIDALWDTFAAGGGDVVLAGHHHFYERFAPIDGVRQFIVGTGGGSIRNSEGGQHSASVKRIETTFGVLRMRLGQGDYDWRFQSASADPASDAGSASCA